MGDGAPSITSILVNASARVFRRNEEFNAVIEGDEVRILDDVNIAVAIDTPRGLYAPVIRRADTIKPWEIETDLRRLAEQIMTGRITYSADYTFTISNLGHEDLTYL